MTFDIKTWLSNAAIYVDNGALNVSFQWILNVIAEDIELKIVQTSILVGMKKNGL